MLTYNQNGTSRGIASIIFAKADTAAKAAKELNGLLVDGRAMKVSKTYWRFSSFQLLTIVNRSRSSTMPLMRLWFPPLSPSTSALLRECFSLSNHALPDTDP